MRHNRFTQSIAIILLGVLVPFWISGESFHHAGCFGHHSDHSPVTTDVNSNSSCCSCSLHAQNPSDSAGLNGNEAISDYHKCHLCEFFKQLNVHSVVRELPTQHQSHICEIYHLLGSREHSAQAPTARGPPSIWTS